MSHAIHVDAYSGYRSNERPQRFALEDNTYEITTVQDRWYEPDAEYFKVLTTEGKAYVLRYDQEQDEWTLVNSEAGMFPCNHY